MSSASLNAPGPGPLVSLLAGLAVAAALVISTQEAPAAVFPPNVPLDVAYVHNSPGGYVTDFLEVREELRTRGTEVRISGYCASACTLFLDLPDVCVYPGTRLGFHMPYFHWNGVMRAYSDADKEYFLQYYPQPIIEWISSKGGLKPEMLWLEGKELTELVPLCDGAPLTS